jgi:mono/diheme cytochrome c family protein
MNKYVMSVIGALILAPFSANAQDVDGQLYIAGKQIFNENCSVCHGENGEGDVPEFPALNGNSKLADLSLIVTNIRQGRLNMPPFPDLDAEQITQVTTFIRNSWSNEYGGVDASQVVALLDVFKVEVPNSSIWDGIFTAEQANRGEVLYTGACALCHGKKLDGAPADPDMNGTPPIGRYKFLRNWDGKSLATLFHYTRVTMPYNNPGYLADQAYIDIIAYMLATSNIPAGNTELSSNSEALAQIVIKQTKD